MKRIILLVILITSFEFAYAQIVNIPDANFKTYLLSIADTNNDGEIQVSEAETVTIINFERFSPSDPDILSTVGIEYFLNLEQINFFGHSFTDLDVSNLSELWNLKSEDGQLQNLNISNCINLEDLLCRDNQLSTINFVNTPELIQIDLSNNQLSSINLDNLLDLYYLELRGNSITTINLQNNINLEFLYLSLGDSISSLDFSNNTSLFLIDLTFNGLVSTIDLSSAPNLYSVSLSGQNLTSIDLSNLSNLTVLNIRDCQISDLDLSNNINLGYMSTESTQLTAIDLSNNPNLQELTSFGDSNIEYINIKNGTTMQDFYHSANYICVDEEEIEQIQNAVNNPNVVINSYCSFEPGGKTFSVNGNNNIDNDMNGCDVSDPLFPNLKFTIDDGTNSGTYISNALGSYDISLNEGSYTITPEIENSTYYTVSPSSITVDFPTDTAPYNQDFCITPNGFYNDLEIALIPLEAAVPGFSPYYKIVYKNKGTTILNGTISLDFEDDYMDFLQAQPIENLLATGHLQWDFINILPFETREILIQFNLNTPTDSNFPLNSGDQLDFGATINPIANDETDGDNVFGLKQIVVNSLDPNDKLCLQGETIAPDKVGDYVHYRIRFENLGTANAVNIVVKDEINTSKFDINSLIPLHSSHAYITNIKDGNSVEFIFENINLPFDDANNDGYIFFKIKTLSTLQLGDTFENNADIYFDFNAPIITNNFSTAVQQNLGVDDYQSPQFKLFPNPSKNNITISSSIDLNKIAIVDINGRVVKTFKVDTQEFEYSLDISSLHPGMYFVELTSKLPQRTLKFVKH